MSEIVYIAATGIIGALSGLLGTYVMGKRILSDEKILDKLDMIVDEYSQNDESMVKLYRIGAILGKGLRDGIGIEKMIPKRKGGLEGLIFDVVGNFIGKRLGSGEEEKPEKQNPIVNMQRKDWR